MTDRRLKLDDGSSWPNPDDAKLEWRLRYGSTVTLSREELSRAADYIAAYKHLASSVYTTASVVLKLRSLRRLSAKAQREAKG